MSRMKQHTRKRSVSQGQAQLAHAYCTCRDQLSNLALASKPFSHSVAQSDLYDKTKIKKKRKDNNNKKNKKNNNKKNNNKKKKYDDDDDDDDDE